MEKKKLLLISAIILLLGKNGYGTLYPDGAVGNNITQDKLTDKHLSDL